VRPTSDASFLETLDVELVRGDLTDPAAVRQAVEGAATVYHCAAKVGDWGPWSSFERETIDATRNVVSACDQFGVSRLLHVSSVAVYGNPSVENRLLNEDEPLGQNLWRWDHYPRSKIAAEALVRTLKQRATIVRPSWIYGPRDRSVIPRILKAVRTGRISLVGRGDNLLNMVYASDVAEACILAATHPRAAGRTYNVTSRGEITQRQLLDALCEGCGLPRVERQVPLRLALRIGFVSELIGRLIRLKRAPYITRRGVSLISRPTHFSSQRARDELGWEPRIPIGEGLRRTLEWLHGATTLPSAASAS
jgi:nucleoside-diphosphate-sugar epimerase